MNDIKTQIDYLKSLKGDEYKNYIIALICFEKGIEITQMTYSMLSRVYYDWMDSDYPLLNDVFYDHDYDLFEEDIQTFLGM